MHARNLYMCVVHLYMCVVHLYMYTCTCTYYICTCMWFTCTWVMVCLYMKYTCTCMWYTCTCMWYTCTCTYVVHLCMYPYTRMCLYMHVYTHVFEQAVHRYTWAVCIGLPALAKRACGHNHQAQYVNCYLPQSLSTASHQTGQFKRETSTLDTWVDMHYACMLQASTNHQTGRMWPV